jgi:hypothetical protein
LGNHVTTTPVLLLTSTALQFCVYGGSCVLTMEGTTGDIRGGSATTLTAGTGYFIGGTGTFRAGTATNRMLWDGTNLEIGSNHIVLNQNGLQIDPNTAGSFDPQYSVSWKNLALGGQNYLDSYETGSNRITHLTNTIGNASYDALVSLSSSGPAGVTSASVGTRASATGANAYAELTLGSNLVRLMFPTTGGTAWAPVAGFGAGVIDLGGPSNKWNNIYFSEPTTTSGLLYPSSRTRDASWPRRTSRFSATSCPVVNTSTVGF